MPIHFDKAEQSDRIDRAFFLQPVALTVEEACAVSLLSAGQNPVGDFLAGPGARATQKRREGLLEALRHEPLAEAGLDFVRLVGAARRPPPAGPAGLATQMKGQALRDDVPLGVPESTDSSAVAVVPTRCTKAA